MGGLVVEDGEDASVQVGLAGRLAVTGHGDDGRAGAVPGDQVGGPADRDVTGHSSPTDARAADTLA